MFGARKKETWQTKQSARLQSARFTGQLFISKLNVHNLKTESPKKQRPPDGSLLDHGTWFTMIQKELG